MQDLTHMSYSLEVEHLDFEQFGPVFVLLGYDGTWLSFQASTGLHIVVCHLQQNAVVPPEIT